MGVAVGVAVVAVLAASFVLPGALNTSSSGVATHGTPMGEGLPAGSSVPVFSGRDLLTGRDVSSSSVFGHKTLLFFSEGVMCQACFEQIQGLQQFGAKLSQRGIQLVSITPDSPAELEQAARSYGITTPLISDEDRRISEAFNTLGKGMHSNTPGHAFALIYRGKVRWYRDYYLPPYSEMYVPPKQLLADVPSI